MSQARKSAPQRPALLLVDPDEERRHQLAEKLAAHGYEVVPTVDASQGERFAQTLGPSVIVAAAGLPGFGDGSVLGHLAAEPWVRRTLLLLGDDGQEPEELPDEVLYLASSGLDRDELARRIYLVLLGRELGAAPDPELDGLVGELSLLPLLELVRALARAGPTCTLRIEGGLIALSEGRVVGAVAGPARGIKAFCRLARRLDGGFRIRLEPPPAGELGVGTIIDHDATSLIIEAIEDVVAEAPDRQLLISAAGAQPASASPLEKEVLSRAVSGAGKLTVAGLLDALPAKDGEIHQALIQLREAGVLAMEEPRGGVRVVTDSTADLPQGLAGRHGITVVPLKILLGKQVLRDGIDIKPKAFYEILAKAEVHPSTNPPSREELETVFREQLARGDVVSLHISGKLSQTGAEAAAAAGAVNDGQSAIGMDAAGAPRLLVLDSESVSLGLGLQAVFAARMAARGLGASAIAERLVAMRSRVHVLFVVDTLEFLARGGRIGKTQAVIGGLLGIKPILGVVAGEVTAVEKARGGRKAHPKIVELLGSHLDRKRPLIAAVAHANAPTWASRLERLLRESFVVQELFSAEMGPVVGTHAGPGTVGTAVYQPVDDAELALLAPID